MANWALLETVTNFDGYSVASDGVDLYFVQYGGGLNYQVFKYTVATDTVSQLSNDSSWGVIGVLAAMMPGGMTIGCLTWFKNNLYVVVYASGEVNKTRVYKYNGSGTAWTIVLAVPGPTGGYAGLVCTANHIVVLQPNGTVSKFNWAYYSSDGSSWGAATVSDSPSAGAGSNHIWTTIQRQSTDKIVVADTGYDGAQYIYRWFQWDGAGNFNITHSTTSPDFITWTPSDAWLRSPASYIGDIYHFWVEGGIYKYAATLGDAWITPGNHNPGGVEITPIVSIGFAQQGGTGNGKFWLLDSGTWVGGDTIALNNGFTHAAKMTSQYAYSINAASRIFGRDTAYPAPDTGRRLYIYKTQDAGVIWTTRKVET